MSVPSAARPQGLHPVSLGRRSLDLVLGGTALVLALPLLLVAAAAILLLDGRPLLHRAVRVGEGGYPFVVPKLRTMRQDPSGPGVTAAGDARITSLGRVLRRLSIDELPQLWCVVRGRMTLVGPRPESAELAARYPAPCRPVLLERPGLTGPAQLRYRERSATPPPGWDVERWYLEVLVPLRVRADLDFLGRATVRETVRWLVMTGLFVTGLRDPSEPPVDGPLGSRAATAPRTPPRAGRTAR